MGKAYCAGSNIYGQLGRGTADENRNAVMQPISGEEHVMVSISSGMYHVCALSSTATVFCWGYGNYGQLGQGNTAAMYVPTLVPGLNNIAPLWCGLDNTFTLLKNDQGAKAFGHNYADQLGLQSSGSVKVLSPVTVFAGETNVVDIQSGSIGICIKLASGLIRCYGYDNYGQLGNDELFEHSFTFVDVLNLPITPSPTALPSAAPTTLPTAQPTASPMVQPTALPSVSPTAAVHPPTTLSNGEEEEQQSSEDLSLVGLVALVPILAVAGAVAYCKFFKPPTGQAAGSALQAPSV